LDGSSTEIRHRHSVARAVKIVEDDTTDGMWWDLQRMEHGEVDTTERIWNVARAVKIVENVTTDGMWRELQRMELEKSIQRKEYGMKCNGCYVEEVSTCKEPRELDRTGRIWRRGV
jgi:hypothetical protein